MRLREELNHPNLGFVLDPATFLLESRFDELSSDLRRLCEQLGPWAPVVHAKDLRPGAHGAATPRAGRGVLDYGLLFPLLRRFQPRAAVILEHLRPEEVAESKAYVERFL